MYTNHFIFLLLCNFELHFAQLCFRLFLIFEFFEKQSSTFSGDKNMEWSKRYGETTLIELDINNRVGSSLSDDKRPALSLVVPSRGTVNGGTPIVVTGLHLIGHGPLFCQFGEFSKN